ncbi:RNA-binding protein [Reinekea marina]|uniref:RNA recognition motif domain-containing protein n=1 Tax=Reinekea marina TaxID=1310421 RepID=A0ABV7WM95_9GAMM|nr:RNA-binding protein [Reinekea marina]MBU2862389.1 RNA-binding protein [Reinekea forsetii]MDN3649935.1 RNA-binding protein [Reinekea marina]
MKILIRNLDRKTTKEELETLFKEYGNVQSCNIVVDKETGESKGFAFVEMPKSGEAKAAIQNLNYKKLGNESIRVKRAQTKTEEE